ncbi:MAG: hypothetical protein HY303_21020 [Candidatus Wallbacteria bacterium]|nr:hypothetical protein [Candidatus Wallbacteria bacterium]
MLFKTPWPIDTEKPQLELKARTIAKIVGQMGLIAAGVGECDLASGPAFALELAKQAGFYLLAANVAAKDGKKPFNSHMLVDVGGVRVGIFGLTSTLTGTSPGQQGLVQSEAVATAREQIAFLRPQCRILICLSHMGLLADQELARQTTGIDVILGGHSRELTTEPIVLGSSLVAQAFSQGKYVGRIDIDAPIERPPTTQWTFVRAGQQPSQDPKQSRFAATFIPLDKNMGEDPPVTAEIKKYNETVAKLGLGAKPPVPPIGRGVTPTANPFVPQPQGPPPSGSAFTYWGAPLCASCHVEQAKFWETTVHAKAIDILRKKNRVNDLECIGCHTTGFRQTGGFDVTAKMAGFESVQCEACHGAGLMHGRGGMAKLAGTESTCRRCHDKSNSPEFDFKAMLPMMSCPKMKRGLK